MRHYSQSITLWNVQKCTKRIGHRLPLLVLFQFLGTALAKPPELLNQRVSAAMTLLAGALGLASSIPCTGVKARDVDKLSTGLCPWLEVMAFSCFFDKWTSFFTACAARARPSYPCLPIMLLSNSMALSPYSSLTYDSIMKFDIHNTLSQQKISFDII